MIWLQFQNSVIDKHISMDTSEDNYIWEHSWIGCFSEAAAKIYIFWKF